ncbi:hypothetical protein EV421DRAFT_2063124 [Armillaria borealis]|uniref:Uncharacterized protein n=1 Tax=Armillaria borealis TaxID=47425 RepID=A0AA39IZS4_9AGAR|nr:hypothetical protein EV421DRAFT_2063124 [Armillaria borealis]
MFPILVGHVARILPPWLLTEIVGWITGIDSSELATMTFITSLLSSRYGQLLAVSMMSALAGLGACTLGTTRRQRYRNSKGALGSP